MKKVIYFGGIIGCVLLTTSCNKSRTCECKVVHTITTKTSAGADTTYNTSPVTVEISTNTTKKHGQDNCDEIATGLVASEAPDDIITATCTLK